MPGLLDIIGQALSMPTALAQQKVNLQASQLANQKLQGLLAAAFPDQSQPPQQQNQQQPQQSPQQQPQQPAQSPGGILPALLHGAIGSINAAQPGGLLPQPQQPASLLPQGQTTQSPTGPVTTHSLLPFQAQPVQPGQQPQPQQQQPQQPWWLTTPSAQSISQIPLPSGLTPRQAQALGVLSGRDPTEISNSVRAQQLSLAQQRYAPIIGKLETIRQTANPMQMIQADPELAAAWPTIARNAGVNPNSASAADVRTALTYERNQLAGGLSEATVAPSVPLQNITLPDGRNAQVNRITGQQTILPASPVEKVQGANGPVNVPLAKAAGTTPYNQFGISTAQMNSPAGALGAQMQGMGLSFPGARTPAAQLSLATNFMRNNPGVDPQTAAQQLYTGQLDFNGAKRSTGQLATIATAADAQARKLTLDFQSLDPLVQRLPNAPAVVNRALTGLSNNLKFGGDKDSAALVGWLREAATEYAKLSSGSTGSAAPAEGNITEAVKIFQNAYTQGGYEGLKSVILGSAQHKRDAVAGALHDASAPGYATGGSAPQTAPTKVLTYDPATGTFK